MTPTSRDMIQVAPFQFVTAAYFSQESLEKQAQQDKLQDPNHLELHRIAKQIRDWNLAHGEASE